MKDNKKNKHEAIKPTIEQGLIIESVKKGKNILVSAFAGSGKTSTLKLITEQYTNKKFLYLAYNTALAKEAQKKFGSNVTVSTIHSIAYRKIGYQFKPKLYSKLYSSAISSFFNVQPIISSENKFNCIAAANSISACAKDTITRYCMSADEEILPYHINQKYLEKYQEKYKLHNYDLNNIKNPKNFLEAYLAATFALAKKLWQEMINKENNTISITHDVYLKLWQLSKPEIDDYDIIMLDESQDANAPILDILDNQKCQMIYVGDTHQQIYSWRGSINAMAQLDCENFYLTKSFRFGDKLAKVANIILKRLGEKETLVGNAAINTEIGKIDTTKPYTIICRTNAAIFEECLNFAKQNKRVYIVGEINQLINLFSSAFYLWKKMLDKVTHSQIKFFFSWERLTEEAELSGDSDLQSIKTFINTHKDNTINILNKIKSTTEKSATKAEIILVTGHKAKGAEWNQVLIHKDFKSLEKAKGEELNLLYVSATRAKLKLESLISLEFHEELDKPFLSIELVPRSCWYSNVRSNISTYQWNKLSKSTSTKAGRRCEICKASPPLDCHEIWDYDDIKKTQKLKGLIALCKNCHEVKHIGYANTQGRGAIAALHLAKVNQWSKKQADEYIENQFKIWTKRSCHKWKLDISWLQKLGVATEVSNVSVEEDYYDMSIDEKAILTNQSPPTPNIDINIEPIKIVPKMQQNKSIMHYIFSNINIFLRKISIEKIKNL